MAPRPKPELARFEALLSRAESGCWIWAAHKTGDGYGRFWTKSGMVQAHRWAYEFFVGPIPVGFQLDHLCRVRDCVNPAHLEPVTPKENVMRGNTPAAANAAKTECARGAHPLDAENTYVSPKGSRECRRCRREAVRNFRIQRRQQLQGVN